MPAPLSAGCRLLQRLRSRERESQRERLKKEPSVPLVTSPPPDRVRSRRSVSSKRHSQAQSEAPTQSSQPPTQSLREEAERVVSSVLSVPCPRVRPLPCRNNPTTPAERLNQGLDCDEVLPGIILASGKTLKNLHYVAELGVTHVINTASRDVWLQAEKLENLGISLFQFHVDDVPTAKLTPYFKPAANMLAQCESTGGVLVVNCLVGFSRSATVLTAALIITRGWTVERALRELRAKRQVRPNIGFMEQLIQLQTKLGIKN